MEPLVTEVERLILSFPRPAVTRFHIKNRFGEAIIFLSAL